jgi:asparagine synthase (glutamine-hydrolysing)
MISEVPLGAFLSGGVDSSAVVAMMAAQSDTRSTPARSPSTTRHSTNPPSPDRWPTATAPIITSRWSQRRLRPHRHAGRLYDEPYADSSAFPTYRVCQLARKHVTVALSGDGGDESFGGYRRYRCT